MQRIINISADDYELLKDMTDAGLGHYHEIILNSTPLDDVLEKIKEEISSSASICFQLGLSQRAFGLREAKDIIDKYKESEDK